MIAQRVSLAPIAYSYNHPRRPVLPSARPVPMLIKQLVLASPVHQHVLLVLAKPLINATAAIQAISTMRLQVPA